MTYPELTQKLRRLGCEFRRQAKGGHEIWWHPERKRYTTISYHGSKDIPKGTLIAILRDLGFTKEDLDGV
jgi:predicted RNA binding protein YcfA (HicA-like mRNA interferase family)